MLKKINRRISFGIDQTIPAPDAIETEASTMSTLQLEQRLQQEETGLANAQNNFSNWNIQLGKQKDLLQQLPETIAKVEASPSPISVPATSKANASMSISSRPFFHNSLARSTHDDKMI